MTMSRAARTRLERPARTASFGAQRNCRTLPGVNATSTVITMTTQGNLGFSSPTEDDEDAVDGSPRNPVVGSPEIFGTGHVGATTGGGPANDYMGTYGAHPPTEGHLYIGHRRALQVRKALLDMLL